ncbi:MAG TPA: SRPBCC family protein [Rhizomicrobium sp.]
MSELQFVYVTYIRATPEKIWEALTTPEFLRKYWFGVQQESDWKPGSSWTMRMPDIGITDSGEILEAEPPRKMVIKWRNEFMPELKAAGFSRCTYEIEAQGEVTKLTVLHESGAQAFIDAVSKGWPMILSSLKSLLETGNALPRTDKPKG